MTGIDYEPASPSIVNLMKSDAVICEEIYIDMTHKAKQMYDMIHGWHARPHKRNIFLPIQLWQYTDILRWHNTYSPYILAVYYYSFLRKRG